MTELFYPVKIQWADGTCSGIGSNTKPFLHRDIRDRVLGDGHSLWKVTDDIWVIINSETGLINRTYIWSAIPDHSNWGERVNKKEKRVRSYKPLQIKSEDNRQTL